MWQIMGICPSMGIHFYVSNLYEKSKQSCLFYDFDSSVAFSLETGLGCHEGF